MTFVHLSLTSYPCSLEIIHQISSAILSTSNESLVEQGCVTCQSVPSNHSLTAVAGSSTKCLNTVSLKYCLGSNLQCSFTYSSFHIPLRGEGGGEGEEERRRGGGEERRRGGGGEGEEERRREGEEERRRGGGG